MRVQNIALDDVITQSIIAFKSTALERIKYSIITSNTKHTKMYA